MLSTSASNAGGTLRSIVRLKGGAQWHQRRESSVAGACGAIFYVIVAGVVWAWLPGGHPVDPLLAGAAALAYVLSMAVTLPLRYWHAAITQPAFVLMLFVLPLNAIPMAVAVCTLAGSCLRIRSFSAARLPEWVNNNWYCVAPTAVLALGAPGPASWSHWPIYVAAFGAQFLAEVLIDVAFRLPAGWDERTSGRVAELLLPVTVDALLTPVGLAVAVVGRSSPGAALSVLVGVLGVLVLLGHERVRRFEHQQRALRDSLTGLANRALFEELADAEARRCARANVSGALLTADLNDFKAINDRYGHPCGDRVLRAFAQRLDDRVRHTDTVARLGGDEFVVLLGESTTISAAEVVADNVRKALEPPLEIPEVGELQVSASIGAARFGPGMGCRRLNWPHCGRGKASQRRNR